VLIINNLKHDDFDYFRHGYDEVRHKTQKATPKGSFPKH